MTTHAWANRTAWQFIDRDEVVRLHARGLTNTAIARQIGCSKSGIDHVTRTLRLVPNGNRTARLERISQRELRRDWNALLPLNVLAHKYQCSTDTIRRLTRGFPDRSTAMRARQGSSTAGIDWTHVAQDELFGSHGEDAWRALTKEQKWDVLYRARELAGIPALKERYDPRGKMWGTECATPTCSRRTKSRTGYCDECRADSDRQRQEAA